MTDAVSYLLTLEAVRERATKVYNAAKDGKLNHFDYDEARMADAADFVASLIMVTERGVKSFRCLYRPS